MPPSSEAPFPTPCLCLVTDRSAGTLPLPEVVEACVAAGVDLVQVRARELSGRELLAHTDEILRAARRAAAARGGEVRVVVNRRVDVALAAGADGVHLGFDGMPIERARELLGPEAWIGVATHAPAEAAAARTAGATYVHFAPVYPPLSKPATRAAAGLGALTEAVASGLPVLAQGGITADNAAASMGAGAAGVAVTGALLLAADPTTATATLRLRLG